MKIWVLHEYSCKDFFDNSNSQKYYSTYELAKKNLDKERDYYKNMIYDGSYVFEFTIDEDNEFSCTDGKWTYDYSITEEKVIDD